MRPTGAETDITELFVASPRRIMVGGLNEPSSGRNKAERRTPLANPPRLVRVIRVVEGDPTARAILAGLAEMLKSGEFARGLAFEETGRGTIGEDGASEVVGGMTSIKPARTISPIGIATLQSPRPDPSGT